MACAINYLGHHTEGPVKVSVPLEGDVIHDHVGGLGEQRVPGLGRQQPEETSGVGDRHPTYLDQSTDLDLVLTTSQPTVGWKSVRPTVLFLWLALVTALFVSSALPGESVLHVVLAVDPRAELQAANLQMRVV